MCVHAEPGGSLFAGPDLKSSLLVDVHPFLESGLFPGRAWKLAYSPQTYLLEAAKPPHREAAARCVAASHHLYARGTHRTCLSLAMA